MDIFPGASLKNKNLETKIWSRPDTAGNSHTVTFSSHQDRGAWWQSTESFRSARLRIRMTVWIIIAVYTHAVESNYHPSNFIFIYIYICMCVRQGFSFCFVHVPRFKADCWWMKSDTYCSFNESCCTFEAHEPLALAFSILAHQLDENIVESGGGGDIGSEHGHVIVNHLSLWRAGGSCCSTAKKIYIYIYILV